MKTTGLSFGGFCLSSGTEIDVKWNRTYQIFRCGVRMADCLSGVGAQGLLEGCRVLEPIAPYLFQLFSLSAMLFPIAAVVLALLFLRRMVNALEGIRKELEGIRAVMEKSAGQHEQAP
jgi:hypothetical protein